MKKKFILGMVAVSMVMGSFSGAMAATRRVEVQDAMKRAVEASARAGSVAGVREAGVRSDTITDLASLLDGNNRSQAELRTALDKVIEISTPDGARTIELLSVGKSVKAADLQIKDLDRSRLDNEGKSYLETLEKAVDVSAQFLALKSASSDLIAPAARTADQQLEIDAFNRQVSLITEIVGGKMDKAEMESHVAVMQAAVQAKTSPRVTGEQAFKVAMEAKYGAKAKEKMNELKNCK